MGALRKTFMDVLFRDLNRLGVCRGDVVFVHSSFKSLGPVPGGAKTVIDALAAAVGEKGLLLMPSFNLIAYDERAENWDIDNTPSTTGWLTECFRNTPGVYRSDHYSHSVAAWGNSAHEFVAGHTDQEGLKSSWDLLPWGKTYGQNSPFVKAYDLQGKILTLGVDYESCTYCHLVEVMLWNLLLKSAPDTKYIPLSRSKLGTLWETLGAVSIGNVGQARCRLFGIKPFVDTLLAKVASDPKAWM